jgi:hypothetical protein
MINIIIVAVDMITQVKIKLRLKLQISIYAIIGFDASRRFYFLPTFLNIFSGHARTEEYIPMDEERL